MPAKIDKSDKAEKHDKKAQAADADTSRKSRDKNLEIALAQIQKQFGEGSIMRLGDESARQHVQVIPTGSLALDVALGVGGVPRGRIVEIYGPEGSGKTTLMLHIIANAQRAGGSAAFIDTEHALDPAYAKKLGVNLDDLLVSQPDSGEEALNIAEQLIRSNALDVLVVDSVAALVPRAELEGQMGDAVVGVQARLMSQAMRKLTALVNKAKTCMIFTNQIREKIGVMYGNPETTPGGKALKFYASVRMDIRRVAAIKEGDKVIGNRTRVKVIKNKVAPPFTECEFDIMYNQGISRMGGILDVATDQGVIEKKGAWLAYNGEMIGQGREAAKDFLEKHPDVAEKVAEQVKAKLLSTQAIGTAVAQPSA
jgi:recombination protein RecA